MKQGEYVLYVITREEYTEPTGFIGNARYIDRYTYKWILPVLPDELLIWAKL